MTATGALRVGKTAAPWLAVAGLTIAATALSTIHCLRRYDDLRPAWSWDLAYYNQWFRALTLGDGTLTVSPIAAYAVEGPSVWTTTYLAPVRWMLAPWYRAVPDPRFFLVVQNVVSWWLIPAAFTLVRSETRSTAVALAATALVPLTPMLWPVVWNDFRELNLGMPFLLWAVQGARGRQRGLTALGVLGMLACRQEYFLAVVLLAVLPPREPEDVGRSCRWAHALVVVGLGWFLFGFLGYLKAFNVSTAPRNYLGAVQGGGVPIREVLATAYGFVVLGLGAWGIFLFVRPRFAVLALPFLWKLSDGAFALPMLTTVDWHHVRYAAPMVASGLAAGLIGFASLADRLRSRPLGNVRLGAVWLAAALFSGLALTTVVEMTRSQPRWISPAEAREVWAWIDRVAPEDGVLAGYEMTAPLSTRQRLYSYRLDVNKPKGYPRLEPEIRWVFLVNKEVGPKLFTRQGFAVVHHGRAATVLRREAPRSAGREK